MTHCRTDIGVSCLPDGKSFYQQCLHYHTSTELTAQQIHDIGLLEVQRIKQLQYIVCIIVSPHPRDRGAIQMFGIVWGIATPPEIWMGVEHLSTPLILRRFLLGGLAPLKLV